MSRLAYLSILGACLLATLPLELALRTRVYARWRRLVLTVVPVAVVFVAWDVAAISAGWWHYDTQRVLAVRLPGRLPVEEVLFFLVIPTCAVLTLEAVRRRRPHWRIGDEDPP